MAYGNPVLIEDRTQREQTGLKGLTAKREFSINEAPWEYVDRRGNGNAGTVINAPTCQESITSKIMKYIHIIYEQTTISILGL